MTFTKRNHVLEETENGLIRSQLAPVQPSGFVILVIRIVVAKLRVQEFVAGPEHWGPVRQHEQTEKILCLLAPQGQHFIRRIFVALVARVPAMVRVRAILVVVAIRPVVLFVVGDEVVQREAVMRSDKVHALISVISFSSVVGEKIVTAVETAHQVGHKSRITLDEPANVIPKPSVPLQPGYAGESASELVSAGVPWLRNQP